jgi:hypothetical protein
MTFWLVGIRMSGRKPLKLSPRMRDVTKEVALGEALKQQEARREREKDEPGD